MSAPEGTFDLRTETGQGPEMDSETQSIAPHRVFDDGRFAYLRPPTERDRVAFFDRSINKFNLMKEDIEQSEENNESGGEEDGKDMEGIQESDAQDEKEKEGKDTEKKTHPLALAVAHLQSNGIDELTRAINLSMLASDGEYLGLTNIVDPALEIPAAATGTDASAKPAESNTTGDALELREEQGLKAAFVLKRKCSHFLQASRVLKRHRTRLTQAIVAQQQPDRRLRQLRPHWRLVAPEHGRRALPHATRPNEVIACDVDVYWKKSAVVLGRLASSMPRYATMELKDGYTVTEDLEAWEKEYFPRNDGDMMDVDDNEAEEMEVDEGKAPKSDELSGEKSPDSKPKVWTFAEPFIVADPSLGKLDADFDPKNVKMITLQFDIEKPSTGFCQSERLEPISTTAAESQTEAKYFDDDERVLVSLQHSLFCAKLFESIRRELAPDTDNILQVRTSAVEQNSVWLSGQADENFLPPPSMMSGDLKCGLPPLCVIHCHEGEVKVQLDSEYTLRVRLIETVGGSTNGTDDGESTTTDTMNSSGSQSPEQLKILCRSLLLYAQEAYHKHSTEEEEKQRKLDATEKLGTHREVHARRKDEGKSSARILQSAVSLGNKMLFERRIRESLKSVHGWLHASTGEGLDVVWLSLSVFDFSSRFTLSFRSWTADVHLEYDELTVTRFLEESNYCKSKFYSAPHFELFLRTALKREVKKKDESAIQQ